MSITILFLCMYMYISHPLIYVSRFIFNYYLMYSAVYYFHSGLDEEGLYRKPGVLAKVNKLVKEAIGTCM